MELYWRENKKTNENINPIMIRRRRRRRRKRRKRRRRRRQGT